MTDEFGVPVSERLPASQAEVVRRWDAAQAERQRARAEAEEAFKRTIFDPVWAAAEERIAVERRKPNGLKRRFFVEGQRDDAAQVALDGNEPFGRLRQREPPCEVLGRDLPDGHRTEKHLSRRIADGAGGGIRQRASACQPKKRARVEKQPHEPFSPSTSGTRCRFASDKDAVDTAAGSPA